MRFGNLNLGVDEFLVKTFENIVEDKVFVYAIRYMGRKIILGKYLILLIKSMSKIILMMCYYHIITGEVIKGII